MSTFTLQWSFKIFTWSSLIHSYVNDTFQLKSIWPKCFSPQIFFCSSSENVRSSEQVCTWQTTNLPCRFLLWNGDFTESCITWLRARCLLRLFFCFFCCCFFCEIFNPLLIWMKCCCVCISVSLSWQLKKFVILHEASSWKISNLLSEEKIAESIFGEPGVAAWLLLLIE